MPKKITAKKFTSNVIISLSVQMISLAVGFILNLIVPKFIDEYQYSYWQTYLLYVGYVGVLHFGLLDGLVLRYSQYDYDELDKERVRSQFKLLLGFTTILMAIAILVALIFTKAEARFIVIFVAIGIISKNIHTYNSYSFQITNRINKYALVVIAQRLTYGVVVVALLAMRVNNFVYYCLADLAGDLASAVISIFFNRGMYFGKSLKAREAFSELKTNVFAGIILMLANFSASLIIGSAKMIVQWRWDELVFGKVSFAFSLSSVFMTFITPISIVLFPSLKRLDQNTLPSLYKSIRSSVSLVLFGIMLFYYPGCWIIEIWLPKYAQSLLYLGYLLPIIIFSSKVNLLTNNYLKVYRKEKSMMLVNVCSVVAGIAAFAICAYVFDSLVALILSIVVVIMANSVASEIMVFKVIGQRVIKEYVIEAAMVVVFILSATLLSRWYGMLAYAAAFLVYCGLNFSALKSIFARFKRKKAAAAVAATESEHPEENAEQSGNENAEEPAKEEEENE